MNSFERLKKIEELTSKNAFVSIEDLARGMRVSQSTVRRDLAYLEQKDLIARVAGDIIWKDNLSEYLRLEGPESKNRETELERRLGAYAASLVRPGDALYVDPGWVNYEMVKQLPADIPLTVSTHDLRIALELEKRPNVAVYVVGGMLRHGFHCTMGELAETNLKINLMRYSKYFTVPAAVSRAGEVMYYHMPSMALRETAHRNAEATYLIATARKFGKTGFVTAFSLDGIDELITDAPVDPSLVRLPENLKITVVRM